MTDQPVDLLAALAESLGIAREDLPQRPRVWSDADGEPADNYDHHGNEADAASRRQYGP